MIAGVVPNQTGENTQPMTWTTRKAAEASDSEASDSEASDSEASDSEASQSEASQSEVVESEEPVVASKPKNIATRISSLLKTLSDSTKTSHHPATIPESSVDPVGFDMSLLPHFPINGTAIAHYANTTYPNMGMEAGVAVYLAGSILVKLENSGHITRIQETVVRLLTRWVRKFTKQPDRNDELRDANADNQEYSAYYRDLETGVEEQNNMQYLRTLMEVNYIKFQTAAHERCARKTSSTNRAYQQTHFRDCLEEEVLASAKQQLRSYLTSPTVSSSIRQIMCGNPRIFLFEFFDQLFGYGDDKHVCNTLITTLANTKVNATPDNKLVLGKIQSLEIELRKISEVDRAGPKSVVAHQLEDDILKWQVLNMASDVVKQFFAANMPPDTSSDVVSILPKLAMDATFRTRLRLARNFVDTDSVLSVSIPVSTRPGLCFVIAIVNMGDKRLIDVFNSFAREYYSPGGGLHKQFLEYLNGERTNVPINIIKQIQLFVQIFAASIMPWSKTEMLFTSKSQTMELYHQYYQLYLHENLPTTDRTEVGTFSRPVRLYEHIDTPNTTTTNAVDLHLSDAFISNSVAIYSNLNKASTDGGNFDDISNFFMGISPSVNMGMMMLHIVTLLCEVASDEDQNPQCKYPVFNVMSTSESGWEKTCLPGNLETGTKIGEYLQASGDTSQGLIDNYLTTHGNAGQHSNTTNNTNTDKSHTDGKQSEAKHDDVFTQIGSGTNEQHKQSPSSQNTAEQMSDEQTRFLAYGFGAQGIFYNFNEKSYEKSDSGSEPQEGTEKQKQDKDMTFFFLTMVSSVVSVFLIPRIKQKWTARETKAKGSIQHDTRQVPPAVYAKEDFAWLVLKQLSESPKSSSALFEDIRNDFLRHVDEMQQLSITSSPRGADLQRALGRGNTIYDNNMNDVRQWICEQIYNHAEDIAPSGQKEIIKHIAYISTLLLLEGDFPETQWDVERALYEDESAWHLFENNVFVLFQGHDFTTTEEGLRNKELLNQALYVNNTPMPDQILGDILRLFTIQSPKINHLPASDQLKCVWIMRRIMALIFGLRAQEIEVTPPSAPTSDGNTDVGFNEESDEESDEESEFQ